MFKPGDRVKYVRCGKFDDMTPGNIYVVRIEYHDSGQDFISIIDDSNYNIINLLSSRFELDLRDIRKQKLKQLKMKILNIKTLKELISLNKIDEIKMKTKVIKDIPYVENTFGSFDFNIKNYDKYISLEWTTDDGNPSICIENENQEINFISDSSDSEYEYLLYLER